MKPTELGPEPNFNYTGAPYKIDWQPDPSRAWAADFIREDGTEDFQGFRAEYVQRNPRALGTGGAISWMPPCVQDYVRKLPNGHRLDIDWELASIPKNPEEIEADRKREADSARTRRDAALAAVEARRERTANLKPSKDAPPTKGKRRANDPDPCGLIPGSPSSSTPPWPCPSGTARRSSSWKRIRRT